ncbi:MAG TPA: chemotaxis protein CheX [Acidimicrobiales bacterium]|nr:chemotaxis protein CheX [Acidimicrobiales bacterium]
MSLEADDVAEIAASVWASMLERSLVPVAASGDERPESAQVSIAGAFDGRVRVEMTSDLARQLTSQLFMMPEEEIDDELVTDAIRELTNIIAGNIKALLPDPSRLGLPGPTGDPAGVVVAEVQLADDNETVVVVVERH